MKSSAQMCLAFVLIASSPAWAVDSISIGGSGLDAGSTAGARPFANFSISDLQPAIVTLELSADESLVDLTAQIFNFTDDDWEGLLFEVTAGSFALAPVSVFGGPSADLGSDPATADYDVPLGTNSGYLLSTTLSAASTSDIVISITPVVSPIPTPSTAGLLGVGAALLMRRRRTGRG